MDSLYYDFVYTYMYCKLYLWAFLFFFGRSKAQFKDGSQAKNHARQHQEREGGRFLQVWTNNAIGILDFTITTSWWSFLGICTIPTSKYAYLKIFKKNYWNITFDYHIHNMAWKINYTGWDIFNLIK